VGKFGLNAMVCFGGVDQWHSLSPWSIV